MIGQHLRKTTMLLLMLYEKEMKICPAYISKSKSTHKKQITILMIPNNKGWHYLAVTKLPTSLRGITSKNNCDFYCLNYLYFHRTEDKLKSQGIVCKNKDFCGIVMPFQKDDVLKFNI